MAEAAVKRRRLNDEVVLEEGELGEAVAMEEVVEEVEEAVLEGDVYQVLEGAEAEGYELVYEETAEVAEGAVAEEDAEAMFAEDVPVEGEAVIYEDAVAEEAVAAEEIVAEELEEAGEEVLDIVEDVVGDLEVPAEEQEIEVPAEEALAAEGAEEAAEVAGEAAVEEALMPEAPAAQEAAAEDAPASLADAGKSKGKGKGKDKGKEKGKGKDKDGGKGKGKGKGKGDKGDKEGEYFGLVYTAGAKTGNMLIRSWKATQKFGQEAMIPSKLNPTSAKVGDKISFETMAGKEGGRPIAINVIVRGHVENFSDQPARGSTADVRRQILYYFSDDNLKQDKFFQGIISSNEGGWIPLATILGCPRMEKMGATKEGVFEAIKGATEVEVREGPPGEEAIRRSTAPPAFDGAAASPSKGAGKGARTGPSRAPAPPGAPPRDSGAQSPFVPTPPAGAPPPAEGSRADELFYAGVVKKSRGGSKIFIDSDAIKKAYGGKDAWFEPAQQPAGVEGGSLVAFTVDRNSERGFAPKASFLAKLAPVGNLAQHQAKEGGSETSAWVQTGPRANGGPRPPPWRPYR